MRTSCRVALTLSTLVGTFAMTSLVAAAPASAHEVRTRKVVASKLVRSNAVANWSKIASTRSRFVKPALTTTTAPAPAPAPAPAAPSLAWKGAQVHVMWDAGTEAEVDRQVGLLASMGANTARVDVAWASLQESGPTSWSSWYVQRLDTFVAKANAKGITPLITLDETPCWASSAPETLTQGCTGRYWDRRTQDWAPTDAGDFARAAAWVAKRYAGKIAALELWNEPNYDDYGTVNLRTESVGTTKAVAYARMVEAAYPAVKAVAPSVPVLAGALSYADTGFYNALVAAGMKSYDGFSVHPYTDGRSPDAVGSAEWRKVDFSAGMVAFRAAMVAKGQGAKPLWITEAGWTNCTASSMMCVSETEQAAWTARSVTIARSWPWLKAYYSYTLLDGGTDRTYSEDNFGLIRTTGAAKPVYGALKSAFAA